jgi:uncharacterized phage protein (TIGR02220 family)
MRITDAELKTFLLQCLQGQTDERLLEAIPNMISELMNYRTRARKKMEAPDAPQSIKEEIPYPRVIAYLNATTGKRYGVTEAHKRYINARWKEGARFDDFVAVIDNKTLQWGGDPKMDQYLRPSTLFGTKFDSYKNEGGTNDQRGCAPPDGGGVQENHRVIRKGKYTHLGTTLEVSGVPEGDKPAGPSDDDIPF